MSLPRWLKPLILLKAASPAGTATQKPAFVRLTTAPRWRGDNILGTLGTSNGRDTPDGVTG